MAARGSDQPERRGVSERRVDQVSALLWLGLGAAVVAQARGLEYMSEFGPSAGFLPFWIGVAMVLLGLVLLAQSSLRGGAAALVVLPSRPAARQMLLIMLAVMVFAALADKVGFLICVGLFFLFLLKVVEGRGWRPSGAIAATCVLICWVVFELLLQLRLPLGLLGLI